ncbi:viral DNA polymerase processivity factor [Cetacean poxvirus 1]|nr:viral DNA polymerase processivity factor [Cetacean poxvirus 1]
MSSSADLTKLKELIKLRNCLHISDSNAIEKYNYLVEWAKFTYWKIGDNEIKKVEISIDSCYTDYIYKPFYIEPGEYTFLPLHFGNNYIYSKGVMIELDTGNNCNIDDNIIKMCNTIITVASSITNVEFLRFTKFKTNWILEDIVSKYHAQSEIFDSIVNIYKINYVRIKVTDTYLFDDVDYASMEHALGCNKKYPISSICFIKDGYPERKTIDFFKLSYVFITSIDVEQICDNCYIPKLVSSSGENILIKNINHIIKANVRIKSFVAVKRKRLFSILHESANNSCNESRGNILKRIINDIGNEFFVNENYLSRVKLIDLKQLTAQWDVECNTVNELINEANNNNSLRKILNQSSTFELTRKCLKYPQNDFTNLVNNMCFKIENKKILHFDLTDTTCINNPTFESIYGNFRQFVAIFNIIVDVKNSIK